ncbi:MAG: hypothetical protein FD130_345, partial [Halothiobacillaceae bacterium]
YIVGLSAATVALLLLLPLPWWGLLPLIVLVLNVAVSCLARELGAVWANPITTLIWCSDGQWQLLRPEHEPLPATLLGDSYLHRHLIILNFVLDRPWRRRTVILWPDSLDAALLHRLRVQLRLLAEHR